MDISEMLINFTSTVSPTFWDFLFILSAIVGFLSVGFAVLRYSRELSMPNNIGGARPGLLIARIIIATLMMHIAYTIQQVSDSMSLNGFDYSAINYASTSDYGRFADTINAVMTLAQAVGGIFFVIGIRKIQRSCNESHGHHSGDLVTQGLIHMLGGCALIQIDVFFDHITSSLGLIW